MRVVEEVLAPPFPWPHAAQLVAPKEIHSFCLRRGEERRGKSKGDFVLHLGYQPSSSRIGHQAES